MRAMRAETFSGYKGLKLVDLPKPAVSDGKVLLRITAVGATPLEHTVLSGQFPLAKAPLILGSEGAGVVEKGGGTDFPVGSRVMFSGDSVLSSPLSSRARRSVPLRRRSAP
jgi:NADPH:quinone reductase